MKRKLILPLFLIPVLLSLVVLNTGCESLGGAYKIEYEVTGDASFVSYFTPDGQQTDDGISTPWTHSFKTSNENQTINLSAGGGSGSVYVTIYLNGESVRSTSESGGLTAITGTYTIADFL